MDVRKPVAAVTQEDVTVVVCDDGSVWSTSDVTLNERWTEHRPIPGTQAEAEDSN